MRLLRLALCVALPFYPLGVVKICKEFLINVLECKIENSNFNAGGEKKFEIDVFEFFEKKY
jgi:hypothetical protein